VSIKQQFSRTVVAALQHYGADGAIVLARRPGFTAGKGGTSRKEARPGTAEDCVARRHAWPELRRVLGEGPAECREAGCWATGDSPKNIPRVRRRGGRHRRVARTRIL